MPGQSGKISSFNGTIRYVLSVFAVLILEIKATLYNRTSEFQQARRRQKYSVTAVINLISRCTDFINWQFRLGVLIVWGKLPLSADICVIWTSLQGKYNMRKMGEGRY